MTEKSESKTDSKSTVPDEDSSTVESEVSKNNEAPTQKENSGKDITNTIGSSNNEQLDTICVT